MPSLVREESQEVTAAAPPPPKQQAATVKTPLTTKNEKRKQSHPVQHDGKQSSSTPNKRSKSQKKKKDPNEPKRPRSAYNFYAMDARPKIIATGVTDVGMVNTQLGEQWKAMPAIDKLPYDQMNLDDKKRYAEEKAAHDAKNESIAENVKQVGGGMKVPYPGNMGEQKCNTLKYTNGGVDNEKQESDDEVIEVVDTEKEVNVAENNDVPSSSQTSPESVVVDLVMEDPKEKNDSLRKEEDDVAANNGDKENNNAPISKVGKGLKGLGKSLASSAKSGVTRLFSKNKNHKENSSKPTTAVRIDVRKSEESKDPLGETRVDSGGAVSGRNQSGEKDGEDQKVSETFDIHISP